MARWRWTPDHPWGLKDEENEELLVELERNWPNEWYVRGPGAGMGPDADPEAVAFVMRVCQAGASPAAAVALERMNANVDVTDLLPSIAVPTLVMCSSDDPLAPGAGVRWMADRIPGAQFIEFRGTSHFVGNNRATPWNDRDAYASCMVLNQNMVQFGDKPLGSMRATVAHEFNHSLQFGMGALTGPTNAKPVWVEGGATWMEDEVFTGSNDNYNYIGPNLPDLRTPMPLYNPSFPYPYWIVFRAMTEQYGGTGTAAGGQRIMRFFWEELSRNVATNTDAFKAAFKSVHSTLADAYHNAGIALRFDEPCGMTHRPYCLKEGPAYKAHGFGGADNRAATIATPLTGSLANDFTTLWVGMPTGSIPTYDISLSVTSGLGWLKASAVCRVGRMLRVTDLGTATAAHPINFTGYDPAGKGCAAVTLVISNVRETKSSPMRKTLTNYSLDLT